MQRTKCSRRDEDPARVTLDDDDGTDNNPRATDESRIKAQARPEDTDEVRYLSPKKTNVNHYAIQGARLTKRV